MESDEGAQVCHSTKQAKQILQFFSFALFGFLIILPINSILLIDTKNIPEIEELIKYRAIWQNYGYAAYTKCVLYSRS